MAAAWLEQEGDAAYDAAADLSLDGKIDNVDSDILAANWQTSGSRDAQHYYFHFDGLGSVVALIDSAGNTIETYAYDVYGQPSNTSNVGNPYFFTGRRFDTLTGLYYYRARYYDPYLGRFLQTDPIGYTSGTNLYKYVGNNPANLKDPIGLAGMTGLFWPGDSPMNPLNCPDAWKPLAIDWEATKVNLALDTIAAIDAYEAALPYVQAAGIVAGGLAFGVPALAATPTTTGGALLTAGKLYSGATAVTVGSARIIATAAGDRELAADIPTSVPGMIGRGFAGDKGAAIGDIIGTVATLDFSSTLSATHTGLSIVSGGMDLYSATHTGLPIDSGGMSSYNELQVPPK